MYELMILLLFFGVFSAVFALAVAVEKLIAKIRGHHWMDDL